MEPKAEGCYQSWECQKLAHWCHQEINVPTSALRTNRNQQIIE